MHRRAPLVATVACSGVGEELGQFPWAPVPFSTHPVSPKIIGLKPQPRLHWTTNEVFMIDVTKTGRKLQRLVVRSWNLYGLSHEGSRTTDAIAHCV
jgi:hypothetical protein